MLEIISLLFMSRPDVGVPDLVVVVAESVQRVVAHRRVRAQRNHDSDLQQVQTVHRSESINVRCGGR